MIYIILTSLFVVLNYSHLLGANGVTHSGDGVRAVIDPDNPYYSTRTGDHLRSYVEARWVAYSKGFDFYYRPFKYSDELMMDQMNRRYSEHDLKVVNIEDVLLIDPEAENTMFMISAWPANNHIDWKDETFLSILRQEVCLKSPVDLIQIPKGDKTIALHIRRGGGFDHPLWQTSAIVNTSFPLTAYQIPEEQHPDIDFPLRFPPDAWYIQMLKLVREKYPSDILNVYIFTDDPCPEVFAKVYAEQLNDPQIFFDYRPKENSHDQNVLIDFFSLMQFECVIRAESSFSAMACALGRPKLEIYPLKSKWNDKELLILETVVKEEEGQYVVVVEDKTPVPVEVVEEITPVPVEVVEEITPVPVEVVEEITPVPVEVVEEKTPLPVEIVEEKKPLLLEIVEEKTPVQAKIPESKNPVRTQLQRVLRKGLLKPKARH